MQKTFVLTVSESKRLIAKGVAEWPSVRRALKEGMVVVATGTTNSYVVEELLGKRMDKTSYRSGLTLPKRPTKELRMSQEIMPDLVLRDGKPVEGLDRFTAVDEMKAGDVYIKGANALDYRRKLAGVLVGLDTGGTIGTVLGKLVGKRIELIIPIGLEKLVYEDIYEISRRLAEPGTEGPRMMPVWGTIITEIEAVKVLTGAEALLVSSGGVGGAEGSVRLLVRGNRDQLEAVEELMDSIWGEPPWC